MNQPPVEPRVVTKCTYGNCVELCSVWCVIVTVDTTNFNICMSTKLASMTKGVDIHMQFEAFTCCYSLKRLWEHEQISKEFLVNAQFVLLGHSHVTVSLLAGFHGSLT